MAQESPSRMFMIQAKEMFDAGKFSAAIMTLREGLKHYPHFISARVLLGEVYWTSGEVALAKAELEQVVKAVPDNFAAHRKLALIYRESGDLDAASRSCRVVLQANPRDLEMRSLLGQLKPKQPQTVHTKSSAGLGEPFLAVPESKQTSTRMESAVPETLDPATAAPEKLDPATIDTETLAELYLVQGHREEGLSVYRRLAAKDPSNVRYQERIEALEGLPVSPSLQEAARLQKAELPPSILSDDAQNRRKNHVRRLEGWLQVLRDRRRS